MTKHLFVVFRLCSYFPFLTASQAFNPAGVICLCLVCCNPSVSFEKAYCKCEYIYHCGFQSLYAVVISLSIPSPHSFMALFMQ